MSSVKLEQLDFCYPGAEANTLSQLNLHVADGEAHALLGASGAGKTTLLNLLSGLISPSSGRVLFDDKDVSHLSGHARGVAQVFQFPVLYENLTVERNLTFSLTNAKYPAPQIQQRLSYIAAELGLDSLLKRRSSDLSLFEKQLVAVGKALMRDDVSLVLLDEPLTAVEPKIKWRLRQTLRRVQEDLGVTMIYVTHDQTEALTFADRVSILTEHGILQTATPEDIYGLPEHEFVGHFVGSPGMNFLPPHAFGNFSKDVTEQMDSNLERVGFRPEWANVQALNANSTHRNVISGKIVRTRVEGTRDGEIVGLVSLATEYGELNVRGYADWQVGQSVALQISRCIGFVEQKRVGVYELH